MNDGNNFLHFLKHCVTHINCFQEKNVILILDNHDSHIREIIDYAVINCYHNVVIPSLIQVAIFGPVTAADAAMKENKRKTMTIYDISRLVAKA